MDPSVNSFEGNEERYDFSRYPKINSVSKKGKIKKIHTGCESIMLEPEDKSSCNDLGGRNFFGEGNPPICKICYKG
jgi:hypothetical protein